MDLRQLRYFLAVAEAGSFTRGAEQVHIAQPALSALVAKLEQELKAQLFLRTSKGAELTYAGRVMVDHARDILRSVKHAEDSVRYASDEVHGEVALGLPATVSMVLTLPFLTEVRQQWPHVALRLVEGHSGWLQEWLVAGRIDAAVLFGVASSKGLHVVPLLDEDLYLVSASSQQRGLADQNIQMAEIAQFELLLPARQHGLRVAIERAAVAADITLNVTVEMDSFANTKKAVANGLGHTILSWAAVAEEIQRGELVARRIVNPAVMRSVVYAVRDERAAGPAHLKVGELVRSHIAKLVGSGRWRARLRI